MNDSYIVLLFLAVCVLAGKKSVKIVQEPANYGGLQAQRTNSQWPLANNILQPFRKPQKFSGPKHFQKLYGKCFTLTDNNYLYELCPFFNVTQREQTWRWNAFQGILGIWKEWSIVNNSLEAMVMNEGDSCPGGFRRSSKIFLKCANKHKFVSVKEPYTCQYEIVFQTPLACPVDAFLVYPLLSQEQQNEWEEIEKGLYHKELTRKGYEKLRRNLFVQAGLLIPVEHHKRDTPTKLSQENQTMAHSSDFKTKDECSEAFVELLNKYEELVTRHQKLNSSVNAIANHSQISTIAPVLNNLTRARGDHGTIGL